MNKSRKKCFVCTAASSSRWTRVSEANVSDICYYYGVKEQLTDIEFLCQACSFALCKAKQNKKEQGSLTHRVKLRGEQFKKHVDTLKKLRFENLNKHRKITCPFDNLPPDVLAHIIYAGINLTGYHPPRADCQATNFFRQNPRPGDSFSVQNSGPRAGKTKQNPHPRA